MATARTVRTIAALAVVTSLGACSGSTTEPGNPTPSATSPTAAATPSPTDSPSASPTATPADPGTNHVPMPAAEPTGWTRVYAADSWTEGTLARDFTAYPSPWRDTSRLGRYVGLADVTVPGGQLTIRLHSDAQGPRSTALQPLDGRAQLYGRYSVRARMTSNGPGFRTAWTLWPENGRYPAGGSIAWPDGAITSAPSAFVHWASASGGKDSFTQPVANSGWHTWTIEWSPGTVVFLVNGRHVGTTTRLVPSTRMHWVLQCETEPGGSRPSPRAVASVQIAWITMATRD